MTQNLNEANKLIAGERGEGWGGLDGTDKDKQQAEQAQLQFQFALRVARVFMTPEGADALEALREQHLYPPTWPPSVTHQQDQLAFGYIREGQKSVVTMIENCIKIAKNPPQQPKKEA
jgi:hypothetical protein